MRSPACHHVACSTPRPPAEKASQQGEAKAGAPMGTPQGDSENIFPRQANTAICFSCLNYTCYLFFKWSVIIGEWGRHPASQCNQNFDIATYLLTNELFIFGKCALWSPQGLGSSLLGNHNPRGGVAWVWGSRQRATFQTLCVLAHPPICIFIQNMYWVPALYGVPL